MISWETCCPQEVDLNAPDEPGPLDQLLIEYQEELHGLYKRSPYFIEKPADKTKDFDDKISRYMDRCVAWHLAASNTVSKHFVCTLGRAMHATFLF
jgi:hypothetical protein